MKNRLLRSLSTVVAVLLIGIVCLDASAQIGLTGSRYQKALTALNDVRQDGPRTIKLANQAVLNLPAGFSFVPRLAAQNFLQRTGNVIAPTNLGLILSSRISEGFVIVDFVPSGFIRESDTTQWDAQQLLRQLQNSIDQNNVQRQGSGLSRIEVLGWVEKPVYDARQHQLIWSVALHEQNRPRSDAQAINYNTYLFGREGYLSFSLATQVRLINKEKSLMQQLLTATSFKPSKKYTDFNQQTDQQALQTMTTLVTSVTEQKTASVEFSVWDKRYQDMPQSWQWIVLVLILALSVLLWHKQHVRSKPSFQG